MSFLNEPENGNITKMWTQRTIRGPISQIYKISSKLTLKTFRWPWTFSSSFHFTIPFNCYAIWNVISNYVLFIAILFTHCFWILKARKSDVEVKIKNDEKVLNAMKGQFSNSLIMHEKKKDLRNNFLYLNGIEVQKKQHLFSIFIIRF